MNMKQAFEYERRNPTKRPKDTIIASPEPFEIGRFMILNEFRYKVKREMTREEFTRKHLNNLSRPDHAVGNLDFDNFKGIPTEDVEVMPSDDQKYFYELELLK